MTVGSISRFFVILVLPLAASDVSAAPMRVVTTGDSITTIYWSYVGAELATRNIVADVPCPTYGTAGSTNTARGGMSGPLYVGQQAWPATSESPINYAQNVIGAQPDIIIFSLGINDVFWNYQADTRYAAYQSAVTMAFGLFQGYRDADAAHRQVIVGSILPMDLNASETYWSTTGQSGAPDRIVEANAWLRQAALDRQFTYVDTWSGLQVIPDWRTQYLGPDGLHPSSAGAQWLASLYASAVPEPSALVMLVTSCGLLMLRKRCSPKNQPAGRYVSRSAPSRSRGTAQTSDV